MKFFVPILCILFYTAMTDAADVGNGETLHMENCTSCHDDSIYTREDRRVTDLTKLDTQVRFCKNNLALMWFDEEVGDVVFYLNQNYYHY